MFNKFKVNEQSHLMIGEVDVVDLVQTYKTPLIAYDQNIIEENIDYYQTNFKSNFLKTRVIYASKAFLVKAMVQLLKQKNISCDAVSGGELYTIKKSGFDMENVFFHGNNKQISEIEMALSYGVGYIVVDNVHELINIASKAGSKIVKTLIRINPGIDIHTHNYIKTSTHSSKFGISIYDKQSFDEIVSIYKQYPNIKLSGFHYHLGSQIFESSPFILAIKTALEFIKNFEHKYSLIVTKLNMGGGFGVRYVNDDNNFDIAKALKEVVETAENYVKNHNLSIDELMIEPGRSIVAPAAVTLYTVGGLKDTLGDENYLFVDGGMTDNIRPALYQAKYMIDIATKMKAPKTEIRSVVGKCCESGDIIAKGVLLPKASINDVVAVYATGAYCYAMSSNYNHLLKPSIIFVKGTKITEVVKRQTLEQLLMNDCDL